MFCSTNTPDFYSVITEMWHCYVCFTELCLIYLNTSCKFRFSSRYVHNPGMAFPNVLHQEKWRCYMIFVCISFQSCQGREKKNKGKLLCIVLFDLINTVMCCSFQYSTTTESQVHLSQEEIQTSNDLSTVADELSFVSAPKQPKSVCKADGTIYTQQPA